MSPTPPLRRHLRRTGLAVAATLALAVVALDAGAGAHRAAAATSVPATPSCSGSEQNPTSSSGYGIPIGARISGGSLTQGTVKISAIDAIVCGILKFPSLSANIPASHITFQVANLTVAGLLPSGTADITAAGPSQAVASATPAPNGGLIFSLTAETANVLNVGAIPGLISAPVSCRIDLSATLNTNPAEGGKALVGPLTGAAGTAYANHSKVTASALTAEDPSDVADVTACGLLNSLLKPQTTAATFTAPLYFYATLTSF